MKKIFTYLQNRQMIVKLFALIWTFGIFLGCSRPGNELPKLNLFNNFDKIVHFVFFFLFAYLWYATNLFYKKSIWYIITIAIFYGFAIEVYQKYCVHGRNFDVWDIVADAIGAISIIWILPKEKQSEII